MQVSGGSCFWGILVLIEERVWCFIIFLQDGGGMVFFMFWGVIGFWDMIKLLFRGVLEYCQEEGDMMEEKGFKI